MPDSPRAVVVLGMHRSGTSVVASVLERIGVCFGAPDEMLDPLPENPRGYWEHRGVKAINEEVLARLGGRWWAPPSLAPGWADAPALDDLRQRARAIVEDGLGRAPLRGLKDPRACLLLPFWRPLLPPATVFVICVRHPFDVARSLRARDDLPLADGIRLWRLHTTAALTHTDGSRRLAVAYDDLLRDPGRVARALAGHVGVTPPQAGDIESLVRLELRHHHAAADPALAAGAIPDDVVRMHDHLVAAARSDDAAPHLILATTVTAAAASDPDIGARPPRVGPVRISRTRAAVRGFLAERPPIAIVYRRVRRLVRRTLGLGP